MVVQNPFRFHLRFIRFIRSIRRCRLIIPIPRTKLLLFLDICKYITIFIPLFLLRISPRDNPPSVLLLPVVWQIPPAFTPSPPTLKKSQKMRFLLHISPKSTTFASNILKQLWNTNLVLAVVLHLFVSTRIPLNANVQA